MKHRKFSQQIINIWLILLFLMGCSSAATPAIKSTPTPPSATTTPSSTQTPMLPGAILYSEDFEDGKVDGLTYAGVNWKIVSEENGNMVYEVNTTVDNAGPSIGFGSRSWINYTVEYRVKMLNPKGDIWMGFRNSSQGGYVQRLSMRYQTVDLYISPEGSLWEALTEPHYNVIQGIWYLVQVEAQGATIRVFINDSRVIEITDSRFTAGDVVIGNLGDTLAQYDDIHVIALGEGIPTSP